MLPNIENTDDLILDFEENEQFKTKTFRINVSEQIVSNTIISSILGKLILGKCYLGEVYEKTETIERIEQLYYINGMVDGLLALQQSILLMLSTEADQYIIYPYTYGITTLDLIGKPSHYVMAVIPERITETLLSDDRITDVSDFEFEVNGNKLTVKFVVHSIYGDIEEETVVIY